MKTIVPPFLRRIGRFVTRYLPAISAFVITAVVLIAISMWIAHDKPRVQWRLQLMHRNFWLGFFGGLIASSLAYFLAWKGSADFRGHARAAFANWAFVSYAILSTAAVGLSIYLATAIVPDPQRSHWESFWTHVAKEPGGFFALVTGLPTLCFLALAVQQLREIRRTISSFSELIDRVCDMAKKATGANPIRILAYTPAVGYLARPDSEWHQFYSAICKKDKRTGKPIAEIICLRGSHLKVWHELFVERTTSRGKINLAMSRQATASAEGLLEILKKDDDNNACDTVHRLPTDFMPGYYFFFTKDRAIIVVPLFLPLPSSAPKVEQKKLPTVQMIGFETADRALVQDVEQMYDYYKELSKSHLPQTNFSASK
jgi:hypothetical protein